MHGGRDEAGLTEVALLSIVAQLLGWITLGSIVVGEALLLCERLRLPRR